MSEKKTNIDDRVQIYMGKVADTFPQKVRDNLSNITKGVIRNMAIKNYARHIPKRIDRWAFTAAEEVIHKGTDDWKNMNKEIDSIKLNFANSNKGYSLVANKDARSLEKQTRYWNNNASVKGLGGKLRTKIRKKLKDATDTPTAEQVETFKQWLGKAGLSFTMKTKKKDEDGENIMKTYSSPSHATPGLSSHGRLRAIDFTVHKGKVVAGTDSKTTNTIWDDAGWTEKLKKTINDTSNNWDGPLKKPYEPWHWTYTAKATK